VRQCSNCYVVAG